MLIALDYDGTYTEDPVMWDRFIALATSMDHRVYIVTMRDASEGRDVERQLLSKVDRIIFTSRKAKRPFMELAWVGHTGLDRRHAGLRSRQRGPNGSGRKRAVWPLDAGVGMTRIDVDGQWPIPKPTPSAPVSFLNISIAVPIGLETIELWDDDNWVETEQMDLGDLASTSLATSSGNTSSNGA